MGVFVPCLQNILGIIYYIRFSWYATASLTSALSLWASNLYSIWWRIKNSFFYFCYTLDFWKLFLYWNVSWHKLSTGTSLVLCGACFLLYLCFLLHLFDVMISGWNLIQAVHRIYFKLPGSHLLFNNFQDRRHGWHWTISLTSCLLWLLYFSDQHISKCNCN